MLRVALRDAERFHVGACLFVFFVRHAAIDFRKLFRAAHRRVLTHEADEDIAFAECFRHIFQHALCIFHLARQDEVADEDAFFEKPVRADFIRPRLAKHLLNRARRDMEIIRRVTVSASRRFETVFQIGEPNLDFFTQKSHRVHTFVPAAIVDDGDGKRFREALKNGMRKMRGRHEIDIVRPLPNEFSVNFGKTGNGNFAAAAKSGNFIILAIDARKLATGKKDGAGAARAADARLFIVMERRTRDDGTDPEAAIADRARRFR